ncbi:MAG: outer membrane protein assembly factor BamA [Candidatus Babeliales bacterium]|nr:outer membrane protein assembly factor BamA [Candidatus Babeliales bacterium]
MSLFRKLILSYFTIFFIILTNVSTNVVAQEDINNSKEQEESLTINKIIVVRKNKNKYLTNEAILNSIPVREGNIFDPRKTSSIIKNLHNLARPFSYFNQIQVLGELLDNNLMNLYIVTYEKYELKEFILNGNKQVTLADITKKFTFDDIHTINETDLERIKKELKQLYIEKNYHLAEINSELKIEDGKATAVININENKKSLIRRIFFNGNDNINAARLKRVMYSREDWVLGFLAKAGSYRPEMVEADKHVIENYYKNNGYFMAKVVNTNATMNPTTKQFDITFDIKEDCLYTIKSVKVVGGDDITCEEGFLSLLPLTVNALYSADNLRSSIERLRTFTGRFGYIFADIDPIIIPDEKTKTLDITFNIELANKVYANRINIFGNKKTREKVIRRRLIIDEGDLVTTLAMDESKDRVEGLGYFSPQNGANWKINRLDDENVDLDLILNEIKTGRIGGQMGFGGNPADMQDITKSFKFGGSITENNLWGNGNRLNLTGEWSQAEWTIAFNVANPYFMERNLLAEYDAYVTKSQYTEELKNVAGFTEDVMGTSVGFGFTTSRSSFLDETSIMFKIGVDDTKQNRRPVVSQLLTIPGQRAELQEIMNERFKNGTMLLLINKIYQDTRNHSLHPSRGHRCTITSKLGVNVSGCLSFAKFEVDASWYTPLIDENKLVFALHGFIGVVGHLGDSIIPYRELFHIGGPASVRGFLFGDIGPQFAGDSIGGKNAAFVNAELIFPIAKDFSIKGAFFYDGGAGWQTPKQGLTNLQYDRIKNNRFDYRHAIGFGIRMLQPTPVKIDWGFKLDRREGEKAYELHLSMYRDF